MMVQEMALQTAVHKWRVMGYSAAVCCRCQRYTGCPATGPRQQALFLLQWLYTNILAFIVPWTAILYWCTWLFGQQQTDPLNRMN